MNIEENRLNTYVSWPANAPISPERLAKGGFYATGRALEVQCFLCGVKISEWNYGDQAMVRHRQADPECPFVLRPTETCNVPLIPPLQTPSSDTSSQMLTHGGSSSASVSQMSNPCTQYSSVFQRLKSFDNWPIPFIVSPSSLARAGFYYLQDNARVKCAFCEGIIMKWDPGDDPIKKHRQIFPNCNFYNHPYIAEVLTAEKGELSNIKLLPGTSVDLSELGVQRHTAPREPKHSTYEGRLRTFEGWPENLKQTPEMLALAGFYYVGIGDQVRCFHCDGGLRNWEETDDAWTEHARWFPKCGFVLLVRGQDFIKHCIDNRPPLDPLILMGVPEDGEEDAMPENRPIAVPSTARSRAREVTDAEVEGFLSSGPAMAALEIGLNVGRVKMAIKQRIESTGLPYANADELIEDVRYVHLAEENDITETGDSESPSSELSNLLNQVITLQSNRSMAFIKNIEKRRRKIENGESSNESSKLESERAIRQVESPAADRTTVLEEENRRLKEARLCKVCMDREVSVVFLPCGHLATCVHCAPSLTHCPMCRQEIRATVRTFLA
ncbi:death-associated inhibitor of apoptosis 2-like [Venturia canescens]|uniref:death-associated inhibitor of apoptosis 2-like n=1 Tax=Venturia canescens TaxID=32260 RepID=UPI001C9BF63A|nr:death-associated inhibitor of apoptosis 2-like [Venturia canescens]